MAKKKKIRVDLRKNRFKPPRPNDWTQSFQQHGFQEDAPLGQERVRAKGDLSRRRTIIQDEGEKADPDQTAGMPAVNTSLCLPGRVLRVQGLLSTVETRDGRQFRCTVRRVLRNLVTDVRSIVATGDHVWILPGDPQEGVIERVEPRHGLLTRQSKGREHVLVANVDQVVIVVSLVDPELKPHLIDRYLASADQGGLTPIICLNKSDLVDLESLQPLIGYYSQIGIRTLPTSARTGAGIERLKRLLPGRASVFSGQSGVGKSSLLNAIQPGLGLRVREVSANNRKGKHTTTTAELLRLDGGGWVVDTPGIRQFQLWNIIPEEVEVFFAEIRPYVALCGFPDCTHTHESRCAVKAGVLHHQISQRRYASYYGLFEGGEQVRLLDEE